MYLVITARRLAANNNNNEKKKKKRLFSFAENCAPAVCQGGPAVATDAQRMMKNVCGVTFVRMGVSGSPKISKQDVGDFVGGVKK